MEQRTIYEQISRRTDGNVYIGVVGPVRTGKSTFIKRFMEQLVLPNIENVYHAMKKVVNENFPQARFIGHFSHWYEWGCMLYARFIFEEKDVPKDPREAAALYNKVWDLAIRAAIANGGVINEHHGVGLKLGRLMKELYGPAMPVLEGIKKQLDPNNIMNPGKLGFKGV